jgi:hypothetical protein
VTDGGERGNEGCVGVGAGALGVGVGVVSVGAGVAVAVWPGEEEVPVGDGLAGREGLVLGDERGDRCGAGEYGRVRAGTVSGAGVVLTGAGAGWTVTAASVTGRTQMYSANTPTNSPMSTSVEVRGRAVTG